MVKPNHLSFPRKPKLQELMQSFQELWIDITALEVKTMVVSEIPLESFVPWQVYQEIYQISRGYLEQQQVEPSLRDRYLYLRQQLELEHALLLSDPQSDLYQPDLNLTEDLRILADPNLNSQQIQTKLPSPQDMLKCQMLLKNRRFICKLRKLAILKGILDQTNADPSRNQVYAQTLIELEGTITNTYTQKLLDHLQRDVILELHARGVEAGEKQWRGIIGLIVRIIKLLR